MPENPKHILVIRLSAMGDVAIVVPVLRALTNQYTNIKVTVLTRPFFAPFFRNLERVSVCPAHLKGKHEGVSGLYKLARQLNKENQFYATADLHNVLRSKVLRRFLKCKRFISIDKGRKEKQNLINGKRFSQLKTTHQRYADVFETLGFPLDLSKPTFPDKANLSPKISALIGSSQQQWIGIAPFAAHQGKMYPLHLMKDLIGILSKTYKLILFGGGIKEIEILDDFQNEFENTINIAGKLNLDEELDLMSNLDVIISMDSGNAHMAAMLGKKVVTIWGVTHPYAGFAPFNQPNHYALLADRDAFPKIPTSVYGNKCPENYQGAAGSISPETIVNKVISIL
ncbi:glycosyltransferase family 9 protein [Changchengzhania lutea]|uniref:glycosyltransferase family 9 protein n=1 Tax=Changchengzhania lutea TaxID=2049305 RepID=UPI001FE52AA8|nr:glycosyltransferase family 9 protein [Changchengzhania lutea]